MAKAMISDGDIDGGLTHATNGEEEGTTGWKWRSINIIIWINLPLAHIMLPIFLLAQALPALPVLQPQTIVESQDVRALPGQLDTIPVFNSNSPELVLQEGILLSTFPGTDQANPAAHLNYPLTGAFDLFAHHVAKAQPVDNLRTLYLGVLVKNPSKRPVTIKILQGASYLSQPDAPFIELATQLDNAAGKIYAGPGSRVMSDILRGQRQSLFPAQITIPADDSQLLMNLPIPVAGLTPPINGRSTYLRLSSSGPVYLASMALFAPKDAAGGERAPNLAEWQQVLAKGNLSTPRDRAPTAPNSDKGIVYGRVAGVSIGSRWQAQLVDNGSKVLKVPVRGQAISWGLATLTNGTLGTKQVQSAPLAVRYPDTAYQAHGNYGVHYSLTLPLSNPAKQSQTVTLAIQTPLKEEQLNGGLRFLQPLPKPVYFRGTVRVKYQNAQGAAQTKFYHLVQKRGQQGSPLVTVTLPPLGKNLVQVDLLYPPDATPPQVLTLRGI
jgi:Protein of unknown function (DUF3370)